MGASVALSADGSCVAVGAPHHAGGSVYEGQVKIYSWFDPYWIQKGLDIIGGANSGLLGEAVALSADGDHVAIGAPDNHGVNGNFSGHVRVYDWISPDWVQIGPDIDGEATSDYSGNSVSLSADGSRVAIGASGNDGNSGIDSGHVRVFYCNRIFDDGFETGDTTAWSIAVP